MQLEVHGRGTAAAGGGEWGGSTATGEQGRWRRAKEAWERGEVRGGAVCELERLFLSERA